MTSPPVYVNKKLFHTTIIKYTTKSTPKTKYGIFSSFKSMYEIGNVDNKNNADTIVNVLLSPVAPLIVINGCSKQTKNNLKRMIFVKINVYCGTFINHILNK